MKLIDRISISRLLNTILNFIITIIKLCVPNPNKTEEKKSWISRWRKRRHE